MSEEQAPTDPRIAAIADELNEIRRRGLDNIDLAPRGQVPVVAPTLENLARTHAADHEAARIAIIRDLLDDALKEWKRLRHAKEADFVRMLFFDDEGRTPGPGTGRPTILLTKAKAAQDLKGDAFDERRRATFKLFAQFLVTFAANSPQSAPSELASEEQAPLASEPAAALDPHRGMRWSWVVAGLGGVAIVVLVTLLLVKLIGGDEGAGQSSGDGGDSAGGTTQAGCSTKSPDTSSDAPVFTFDALCGGSQYIRVFPGVQDTPTDKVQNGTFEDGQKASAVCKTTGRTVSSDPSVGELPRESDVWIQVVAQPGKESYASLTYGQMSEAALATLPECAEVP